MRVRVVDLAGNSVDMGDPDDSVATAPVPYRRFDPVLPPTLVPRAAFREGASVERMVIRSDRGVSASEYAASHPALDGAPPLRAVDDRHLLPPSAAELTVEMSGLLDDAFAPGGDPVAAYELAAREAHTVRDHVAVDPTDLNRVVRTPQPGAVMVAGRDPLETGAGDRPEVAGAYLIIEPEHAIVEYLPDPSSRGASLRTVAPEPGQLDRIILEWHRQAGRTWHQPQPFVLRIAEPDPATPPNDDPDAGPVVFPLPQAEIVTIRYSSLPDLERVLRESGVWAWGAKDELLEGLKYGDLWPVTPWRTLTLVHAVQHPLLDPIFADITPERTLHGTSARLPSAVLIHVKSTGTLDIDAAWLDWVDDPVHGTANPPGRAHVAQVPVERALALPGSTPVRAHYPLTAQGPKQDAITARAYRPSRRNSGTPDTGPSHTGCEGRQRSASTSRRRSPRTPSRSARCGPRTPPCTSSALPGRRHRSRGTPSPPGSGSRPTHPLPAGRRRPAPASAAD